MAKLLQFDNDAFDDGYDIEDDDRLRRALGSDMLPASGSGEAQTSAAAPADQGAGDETRAQNGAAAEDGGDDGLTGNPAAALATDPATAMARVPPFPFRKATAHEHLQTPRDPLRQDTGT